MTEPVKQMNVRCNEAEKTKWRKAAYAREVSLSEWVRRILNHAAEATLKERDDG